MKTPERIKLARQRRNFTQRALAEKLGITVQAVSQWETGRTTPAMNTFPLLSEVLRADIDWLMGASDREQDEFVPSALVRAFGEKAPIVNMRDVIPFIRGMNPPDLSKWPILGLVTPTNEPIGQAFATKLNDDGYFDGRFSPGDLLIFDNGVNDDLGDIVLSAILLREGRFDIALAEVIGGMDHPDFGPQADIRPLSAKGVEMHDQTRTLFFPVVAVMVEHRRFRRNSSDT